MKKLPIDVDDDRLLRAVGEWVDLLADDRYQDAYDFLYHPWMPVLPKNEINANDIRNIVTNYGWDEPHPNGPFRVTRIETAPPRAEPSESDIQRDGGPRERAWDSTLVRHGGVPSGASSLGTIHFDLPLNGAWSDLTAIFRIVLYDGAVVLALESIDVL